MKVKNFRSVLFLASALVFILFISSPVVFARRDYLQSLMQEDWEIEREIDIVAGDIKVLAVRGLTRVSIRNPNIADVQEARENQVIIAAKSPGTTLLTVWTPAREKQFRINVTSEDLPSLKERLSNVIHEKLGIRDVVFRINRSSGKIMLLGNISSSQRSQVEQVLAPFSRHIEDLLTTKREQEMVEIDVQVLELNRQDVRNIGVDWVESVDITEFSPLPSSSWRSLWQTGTWSRGNLSATINMLMREGRGRVLSRPKLLCLSGEEAELLVGGEVPYLSQSTQDASGTTATIEYKEYGIRLLIRPFILGDQVYLSITSEVTDLDPARGIVVQGTEITAFSIRRAQTVVNVNSGDTVFLGGLISHDDTDVARKMPGFSNIPILGALFRSRDFQKEKTELFITLTPKVIDLARRQRVLPEKVVGTSQMIEGLDARRRLSIPENLQSYAFGVQRKIMENVIYPRELSGTGWQGTVTLSLTINKYGELREARIKESSGYRVFDRNAQELVKRLTFYPFPSELKNEAIDIEIPIVYRETN